MTDSEKKSQAVRSLINLAIAEGMLLFCVVLVWLKTQSVALLIGGFVGAQLIFIPMFMRWAREQGAALKQEDRS